MALPRLAAELVTRFRDNAEEYRRDYGETETRREFLDPLFKMLGWDIENAAGHSEAYKDVVHEDSVKIGVTTSAPDYSFRVGGVRKFFLEAKKPAINIRDDPDPAYQLRRYAWSAKLPLSIVSNFAEFAVYDCRVRPSQADKSTVARLMYFTHSELPKYWDQLASIFSKEAVYKGSFDRFAASKARRGTAEVDDAFLEEIESWRDSLARNIALRNSKVTQPELNYAVQQTIDRIIFLRICEDRGIETYGRLRQLMNGEHTYARLRNIFQDADDRYNSGLFHFRAEKGRSHPDELTLSLEIDDKVLKDILRHLYYPESPYEFSVLPADILGQVYEQFLGKLIRLTAGGHAKVEDKPEVKKAGGVYYTPTFVVDYIVRETIGKLLEGSTPEKAAKLRVLDPACGSGSFLIGAYQYLLDWHRTWYETHGAEKHSRGRAPKLYRAAGSIWRLTTPERKRILLNNIFGVDIDPQAVEVTKLSLLLKVLEDESAETLGRSMEMFHERALPDLDENIKCGNSLVRSDYADGTLFAEAGASTVNPFDWEAEFPEIIKQGGFQAVIGNPPWGAEVPEGWKQYFDRHYKLNAGKYESYVFFVERASHLLHKTGRFGFILPSFWISRTQTEALRAHLCGNLYPVALVVLPENVFEDVQMDSCIVVAQRKQANHISVAEVARSELPLIRTGIDLAARTREMALKEWVAKPKRRFNPRITSADTPILDRIEENTFPLGDVVEVTQGLTLYRRSSLIEEFGAAKAEEIVTKRLFHSDRKKDKTFKKELSGTDVARFDAEWNRESWVSYGPWLAHAVDERFFKGPRLVIQKLRNPSLRQRLVAGYLDDDETYSAGVLLNAILKPNNPYSIFFLLGVLNSKLINYWYRKMILDVSIRLADLEQVPIRTLKFKNGKQPQHDQIARLASEMVNDYIELRKTTTPPARKVIGRRIDAADRRIDVLVYEIYGITKKQAEIVEASSLPIVSDTKTESLEEEPSARP